MMLAGGLTAEEEEAAWREDLSHCLDAVPAQVIGLSQIIHKGADFDFSRTLDGDKLSYARYPISAVSIDFQSIFAKYAEGVPLYASSRTCFAEHTRDILQRTIQVWQEILNAVYQRHFQADGQPRLWFKTAINDYLRAQADAAGHDLDLEALWGSLEFRSMALRMMLLVVPSYLADAYHFLPTLAMRRLAYYTRDMLYQRILGLPLTYGHVQATKANVESYDKRLDSAALYRFFYQKVVDNEGLFESQKMNTAFMEETYARRDLPIAFYNLFEASVHYSDAHLIRSAILNLHFAYNLNSTSSLQKQQIVSCLEALDAMQIHCDTDNFATAVDFIARLIRCGQAKEVTCLCDYLARYGLDPGLALMTFLEQYYQLDDTLSLGGLAFHQAIAQASRAQVGAQYEREDAKTPACQHAVFQIDLVSAVPLTVRPLVWLVMEAGKKQPKLPSSVENWLVVYNMISEAAMRGDSRQLMEMYSEFLSTAVTGAEQCSNPLSSLVVCYAAPNPLNILATQVYQVSSAELAKDVMLDISALFLRLQSVLAVLAKLYDEHAYYADIFLARAKALLDHQANLDTCEALCQLVSPVSDAEAEPVTVFGLCAGVTKLSLEAGVPGQQKSDYLVLPADAGPAHKQMAIWVEADAKVLNPQEAILLRTKWTKRLSAEMTLADLRAWQLKMAFYLPEFAYDADGDRTVAALLSYETERELVVRLSHLRQVDFTMGLEDPLKSQVTHLQLSCRLLKDPAVMYAQLEALRAALVVVPVDLTGVQASITEAISAAEACVAVSHADYPLFDKDLLSGFQALLAVEVDPILQHWLRVSIGIAGELEKSVAGISSASAVDSPVLTLMYSQVRHKLREAYALCSQNKINDALVPIYAAIKGMASHSVNPRKQVTVLALQKNQLLAGFPLPVGLKPFLEQLLDGFTTFLSKTSYSDHGALSIIAYMPVFLEFAQNLQTHWLDNPAMWSRLTALSENIDTYPALELEGGDPYSGWPLHHMLLEWQAADANVEALFLKLAAHRQLTNPKELLALPSVGEDQPSYAPLMDIQDWLVADAPSVPAVNKARQDDETDGAMAARIDGERAAHEAASLAVQRFCLYTSRAVQACDSLANLLRFQLRCAKGVYSYIDVEVEGAPLPNVSEESLTNADKLARLRQIDLTILPMSAEVLPYMRILQTQLKSLSHLGAMYEAMSGIWEILQPPNVLDVAQLIGSVREVLTNFDSAAEANWQLDAALALPPADLSQTCDALLAIVSAERRPYIDWMIQCIQAQSDATHQAEYLNQLTHFCCDEAFVPKDARAACRAMSVAIAPEKRLQLALNVDTLTAHYAEPKALSGLLAAYCALLPAQAAKSERNADQQLNYVLARVSMLWRLSENIVANYAEDPELWTVCLGLLARLAENPKNLKDLTRELSIIANKDLSALGDYSLAGLHGQLCANLEINKHLEETGTAAEVRIVMPVVKAPGASASVQRMRAWLAEDHQTLKTAKRKTARQSPAALSLCEIQQAVIVSGGHDASSESIRLSRLRQITLDNLVSGPILQSMVRFLQVQIRRLSPSDVLQAELTALHTYS